MTRTTILVLPPNKQPDLPFPARRSRLFFGDGSEILGLSGYVIHGAMDRVVLQLEFENVDLRYLDEPPGTQPVADAGPVPRDDMELCRQWFDAVQDLNPRYLERADYALARRLYTRLGMRVPHAILRALGEKP